MPHLTRIPRRWAVLAAVLIVVVAAAGRVMAGPAGGDHFNRDIGGGVSIFGAHIGEPLFMHLWDVDPRQGTERIHVLKIEILGAPNAMVIDRVAAIDGYDGKTSGGVGAARGENWLQKLQPAMQPVDHISVMPRCPVGSGLICYPWFIQVQGDPSDLRGRRQKVLPGIRPMGRRHHGRRTRSAAAVIGQTAFRLASRSRPRRIVSSFLG
jgi:hypothetical protein